MTTPTTQPKRTRRQRRQQKKHKKKHNPTPEMIKFIHCNVNGIQKQNDPDGLPQIIHQFQSHQADIISINETNTDTSQSQIHYDLIQQFKQQDKHAQISFSHSTREQSKSRYKPGGTMIALLNK